MTPLEPRLFSVAQAAMLLGGVSERHVHGLIADGRIRCVRIGRRVLVPREVIDDIVRQGVPEKDKADHIPRQVGR